MDRELLKPYLECPVCLEVRRDASIYICINGHLICSKCHSNKEITRCPVGRCRYNNPPTRILPIEKLIEESDWEFPCKNEEHGCKVRGANLELRSHESVCDARTVQCPLMDETVKSNDLLAHLREKHADAAWGNYYEEGTAFEGKLDIMHFLKSNLEESNWSVISPEFQGETFVLSCSKNHAGYLHCWVNMMADQKRTGDFTVKIRAEEFGSVYKKRCRVHPLGSSPETIVKGIDCIHLSETMVRQYMMEEDNGLKHSIDVRCLILKTT